MFFFRKRLETRLSAKKEQLKVNQQKMMTQERTLEKYVIVKKKIYIYILNYYTMETKRNDMSLLQIILNYYYYLLIVF